LKLQSSIKTSFNQTLPPALFQNSTSSNQASIQLYPSIISRVASASSPELPQHHLQNYPSIISRVTPAFIPVAPLQKDFTQT
ncbi:hypothetical protein BgiBS90_026363, partial [Biomphalaria glabrata]